MLRSGQLEVNREFSERPLCTFSFLNEAGEIYLWGCFGIPLKGAQPAPDLALAPTPRQPLKSPDGRPRPASSTSLLHNADLEPK